MPSLSQQFSFKLAGTAYGFVGSVGNGYIGSYGRGPALTSVSVPFNAVSLSGNNTFRTEKLAGEGYYGSNTGLHTVTYTVSPYFKGTVKMQATLSTEPTENDWFDVDNTVQSYNTTTNVVVTTTTNYINFTGNFVWVRALMIRESAPDPGYIQCINYIH